MEIEMIEYTNGMHAIVRISPPRPAEHMGTQVDIEVGWIEFHKTIPFINANTFLDMQMKYHISESGLLLVDAEGRSGDKLLTGDIVYANQMKGTVVKLLR
jgi:hypothetical protein